MVISWFIKTAFPIVIFALIVSKCYAQDDNTVPNFFKLRFAEGSTMGIFVALAFPIDLPGREVYYSHFFEAIHNLPTNESYSYPPIISRNVDRQLVYRAFERKINSNGYPGKSCLLRIICEVAQSSVDQVNGVLGEILHIIFTPSSTINVELPQEYEEAEIKGRNHECLNYNKNCTVSFLDLISLVESKL